MPKKTRPDFKNFARIFTARNITPSQIFHALSSLVSMGSVEDLHRYFEMATTDGHTQGVLQQLKSTLLTLRTNIETAKVNSKNQEEAEKHAKFIQDSFDKIDISALKKFILSALLKKVGLVQIDWQLLNGYHYPKDFKMLPSAMLKIDIFKEELYLKYGREEKDRLVHKQDDLIKVFYNEELFPIMFSVLKNVIIKEQGIMFWFEFIERFGQPIIAMFYKQSDREKKLPDGKTQYDQLKTDLDHFHASGKMLLPDGTEIQIQESYRNTYDHKSLMSYCNEEIDLAILLQKNTTGADGQTSRNNLSTMEKLVKNAAIYRSDFVYKVINEQLIPRMIRFNFNTKLEFFPKLVLNEPDFEMAQLAIDSGYQISKDYFESFGIPIQEEKLQLKKGNTE